MPSADSPTPPTAVIRCRCLLPPVSDSVFTPDFSAGMVDAACQRIEMMGTELIFDIHDADKGVYTLAITLAVISGLVLVLRSGIRFCVEKNVENWRGLLLGVTSGGVAVSLAVAFISYDDHQDTLALIKAFESGQAKVSEGPIANLSLPVLPAGGRPSWIAGDFEVAGTQVRYFHNSPIDWAGLAEGQKVRVTSVNSDIVRLERFTEFSHSGQ